MERDYQYRLPVTRSLRQRGQRFRISTTRPSNLEPRILPSIYTEYVFYEVTRRSRRRNTWIRDVPKEDGPLLLTFQSSSCCQPQQNSLELPPAWQILRRTTSPNILGNVYTWIKTGRVLARPDPSTENKVISLQSIVERTDIRHVSPSTLSQMLAEGPELVCCGGFLRLLLPLLVTRSASLAPQPPLSQHTISQIAQQT